MMFDIKFTKYFMVLMALLGYNVLTAQFNTIKLNGSVKPISYLDVDGKNDTLLLYDSLILNKKDITKIATLDSLNMSTAGDKTDLDYQMGVLPLSEIFVTSEFGLRYHPLKKEYRMHRGVDLRGKGEKVFAGSGHGGVQR